MVHETSCQEMAPSLNTMTPQSLLLPKVVTGRCFFQWAFATAREYPSCIWKKRMEKKLSKKERNHARNQKSGSRGKKTSWTSSSVNFPLLSLSPIGFAQSPPITTNYTGRKTCKNGCIPRSFVTCFKCDDFICYHSNMIISSTGQSLATLPLPSWLCCQIQSPSLPGLCT